MRDYEARKQTERERQSAQSRVGRDVASFVHAPLDPARKAAASASLRVFCESYCGGTFSLAWAPDHLRVLDRLETAVIFGGQFALAMPRGAGKSSLASAACVWAALTGRHQFIALLGATEDAARELLSDIRIELETNDLLEADWSEVVGPIRALEGIANRARGQLFNGQRTHVGWNTREIVLPVVAGSAASGTTVRVAGILGRIRGMKLKRAADGVTVRPSLVLIDDPQTDSSAESASQCNQRERTLSGAILGLGGPGKKLSAVMPLTVVRPGDVADRVLDGDLHPEWHGERTRMVYAWPVRDDLWTEYARIRRAAMRDKVPTTEATEYYRQHKEEMDKGANVAWPERHNADELSALQHAFNLRADLGEEAFSAEYQNDPIRPDLETHDLLTAEQIMGRVNRIPRGTVPVAGTVLTAGIDVHDSLLVWVVTAWSPGFDGWLVDYGAWPGQPKRIWTMRKAGPTLSDRAPGASREGWVRAGLDRLADEILGREWEREDGVKLRISRCLVDSGYLPDVVQEFARRSPHGSQILASRGFAVSAKNKPMADYQQRPGEQHGWYWLVRPAAGQARRHLVFDANHWKSFVHARLRVQLGDNAGLTLYGERAEDHRLLATHLTAEYAVRTSANGRSVDEWTERPGGGDNHLLDATVLTAVAASREGSVLAESQPPKTTRRKPQTIAEIKERRKVVRS